MRILWCWRCKTEVPMLDDKEWQSVWDAHETATSQHHDGRPAALAAYERLTGYKEANFNALFHHRISDQGPPCPGCGKVLRTPVAYKCFECGLKIHEPNWTYLFRLEIDVFTIKGRGLVAVANEDSISGRVFPGSEIEFRDGGRIVGRATLISIERFHGAPSGNRTVGLLLDSKVPHSEIRQGQDAWLVFRRDDVGSA